MTERVHFRSLSTISARERDAAISAGNIGVDFMKWAENKFSLPELDIPNLSQEKTPELAAFALRQYWGLGERPIGNLVSLLEAKGISLFSLAEETKAVDAFSFWSEGRPYIFMNHYKTAERSLFDAGHELGHLVLHRDCNKNNYDHRQMEKEADAFSSAFLMPEADVRARMSCFVGADFIIKAKFRWRVSAMAMLFRLHMLNIVCDWQYKSLCIELGRRGYRTGEPQGIEREVSYVWKKVFSCLWREGIRKDHIAETLCIPLGELEKLVHGLLGNTYPIPQLTAGAKLRAA